MVQTRHQTHESDQTQQKEDPSTTGSEDSKVGQSDHDSVGATSEVLSLQLVPLITQGQQNHLELMGINERSLARSELLDRENRFLFCSNPTTSGGARTFKATGF